MGNPLPGKMLTGTIGELLVQLRLLEFGVQAAPPIKDSGNDLIAIKGEVVRFIQVKTKVNGKPNKGKLPKVYHLLCLVNLKQAENGFLFDDSEITVLDKNGANKGKLNADLVRLLWAE